MGAERVSVHSRTGHLPNIRGKKGHLARTGGQIASQKNELKEIGSLRQFSEEEKRAEDDESWERVPDPVSGKRKASARKKIEL